MKPTTIAILTSSLILFATSTAAARPKVVVTIKPLHSLVLGVVADVAQVELLLQDSISPHNFQLQPSHLRLLQQADVLFYIADDFETFLQRAFTVMPDKVSRLPVMQDAGLRLLPRRSGGVWDGHSHGISREQETQQGYANAVRGAAESKTAYDMHVWLDSRNAGKIALYIAAQMSELDPANAKIYKANAAALSARLEQLHNSIAVTLASGSNNTFIVFHDALQYFERAYNLNAAGAITVTPELPPTASRVIEIRRTIKQRGARCVFSEPQYPEKLVQTVIADIDVELGAPLDVVGMELQPGEDLYFTLMHSLADNIGRCLQ